MEGILINKKMAEIVYLFLFYINKSILFSGQPNTVVKKEKQNIITQ